MRLSTFIFFCLLVASLTIKSQTTFQKTFGGTGSDYGFSISPSANKGFIIAGYTDSYSAGANDFFVTKTDSLGNTVWQTAYGGTRDDEGYCAKQTNDGGFIIAGYSKSFGAINYNAYLVKTNANGDTLWTKTYGGLSNDFTNSIQQTSDGGYILAGYTTTFVTGADSGNIYLIKTDGLGNLKWTKSFGANTAISDGYSIAQTSDNGYIITGYTNGFNEPNGDAFLLKTDSLGNIMWTKTYGSAGVDWGNSVKQTTDGGYIMAGSASFDTTNLTDVYLIKTNAVGDTLWTKTYGGAGYDFGQSLDITTDGGFIITGYTNSYGAGNYDVYLIKTDANGNISWSSVIGSTGDDEGNSVYQTADGGYAIAGVSNSYGAGDYDVYLIKTDANGNTCNQTTAATNIGFPKTIQTTQIAQSYTTNTVLNHVHTLLDTASLSTDICMQSSINPIVTDKINLTVFPNPSTGIFTVLLTNSDEKKATVTVQNILGETVYTSNTLKEINVQYLPSGAYFIKISTPTKVYSQKVQIFK
ncbi:MAG: T9SS type A sorting domain-containing protein [Bacteroidia bacterium]